MRLTLSCTLLFCLLTMSRGERLLPDVPRVGLHTLYEQSRNGRRGKDPKTIVAEGERFLVVGTAVRAPEGQAGDRWFLVGGIRACCNMFQVGLPLRGKDEFEDGQWIAVHGYLQRSGPAWTRSNVMSQGQPVFLGGDDLGIMAEEILPAEKILHPNNIIDSLSSEALSSFQQTLEWSGLENELRAADAVTLLVPHNAAMLHAEEIFLSQPPEPQDVLAIRHWLLGHMVEGRWTTKELLHVKELTMMNGDVQIVTLVNGSFTLGGSRMLMKNIAGQNGVAHIMTPVLPVSRFEKENGEGEPRGFSSDPLDL